MRRMRCSITAEQKPLTAKTTLRVAKATPAAFALSNPAEAKAAALCTPKNKAINKFLYDSTLVEIMTHVFDAFVQLFKGKKLWLKFEIRYAQ